MVQEWCSQLVFSEQIVSALKRVRAACFRSIALDFNHLQVEILNEEDVGPLLTFIFVLGAIYRRFTSLSF